MACAIYQELITKWRRLIFEPQEDDATVAAYWTAIGHRTICEVCRDENLAEVMKRLSPLG